MSTAGWSSRSSASTAPADGKVDSSVKHVDGRALCLGLRDYAIEQYGLMSRMVLRRWRITSCKDFGEIVFAMVDAGLMKKTENDSIRDFVGVYDFDEAFTPQLELSGPPPLSPEQNS